MTTNEITETLTEVREAVAVPPVDELAFQRLVGRERRRRTTGRVLVASAAAVVLAAGVGLAVQLDEPDQVSPAGTPEKPRVAFEAMAQPVPFLKDHVLQVRLPDGTTTDTGVRLEEVLALTEYGLVGVDNNSRLLLFPLRGDGRTGPDTEITEEPVQRAWLSKDGFRIGWVGTDNVLHLRELGTDHDYWTGQLLSQQTQLMALDGLHWIEDEGDRLSLRYPDASYEVHPVVDPVGVELAGDTLAVMSAEGVEIFSAVTGKETWPGGVGGGEGALSPDGRLYAAGYPQGDVESGASQIFELIDTTDGSMEAITLVDYDGVLDISWTGTNFLALVTHDGKYSVLECSPDALACEALIKPTTARLQLPSS